MAFLGHLCLIASGLFILALFVAYPRSTAFFTITLFCGYLGSSGGFLGTVFGLLIGAALGGAVAGVLHGIGALFKLASGNPRRDGGEDDIAHAQEFMRRRDAEHSLATERTRRQPPRE